jgi:hypothetical protein
MNWNSTKKGEGIEFCLLAIALALVVGHQRVGRLLSGSYWIVLSIADYCPCISLRLATKAFRSSGRPEGDGVKRL